MSPVSISYNTVMLQIGSSAKSSRGHHTLLHPLLYTGCGCTLLFIYTTLLSVQKKPLPSFDSTGALVTNRRYIASKTGQVKDLCTAYIPSSVSMAGLYGIVRI